MLMAQKFFRLVDTGRLWIYPLHRRGIRFAESKRKRNYTLAVLY